MADASQLALGTLKLEDTKNEVTLAQAAELLPLWRMIEGGSLKSDTETSAVLRQIEEKMSGPQLAAINMMELGNEDVRDWMQEQGLTMPAPSTSRQGSTAAQGTAGSQDSQGGPGALQSLSEEDRAKMREEFQNMTAKERATRMAEMGVERPEHSTGARPSGGMGPANALFGYLVEYLAGRAEG
jgi:hypothetical protein